MVSENVDTNDLKRLLREMEKGIVEYIFKNNFSFAGLSRQTINVDVCNRNEYETRVVESPLIY